MRIAELDHEMTRLKRDVEVEREHRSAADASNFALADQLQVKRAEFALRARNIEELLKEVEDLGKQRDNLRGSYEALDEHFREQDQLHKEATKKHKESMKRLLHLGRIMHDTVCRSNVGLTEGLGLILCKQDDGNRILVESVLEGGRAHASEIICQSDYIVAMDGRDVKGMGMEEVERIA
eukprot:446524-Rhodomonas_salina.1